MTSSYDDLIAALDLTEKVRLLTGATMFTLWPEPKIGLRELAFSDGPTGVRGLKFAGGERVALFPNATLLASAWDEATAEEAGSMLGEEAIRQHIHTVLGPTINLHRTPLGGRLFEAYSEDPLLTGRLAAAYVRGMQAHDVAACPKHLVANESETERNFMDSRVAEDVLRELYLLPFEIVHTDANPWTMMAAYNRVNGVSATEHDELINDLVKGEWGYDGLVMSDWLAAKTTEQTANGGLDLIMPGPEGPWGEQLVAAVREGRVAESAVDDHLRRLLRLADRTGALCPFDSDRERDWPTMPAVDSSQRAEQLRRLATGGMTVLRNENATLPLARDTRVALIGRHAVETICMGGGSAQVNPPYQVSIAEGLEAAGVAQRVVDGVEVRVRGVAAKPGWVTAPSDGSPGMDLILRDADRVEMTASATGSTTFSIGFDDDTPRPVAYATMTASLAEGGRLELGVIGAGRWSVRIGERTETVELTTSGHDPGEAMLKPPFWTTLAEVEPGTVIEAVLDADVGNEASQTGFDFLDASTAGGKGMKGLIARPAPRPSSEVIAEAVEAARDAEVAVVVVGLTEEQETEAVDKSTLALPGDQDALVAAVAGGAPKTVVVVNAATPILMPWADRVDAIMVIGLPGQEGGHAVADALLGKAEPAGRLVTTWPVADGTAPAWTVEPTDLVLDYADGRFVGYRGYAPFGLAPEPAYWLGAGLGYGSWAYAGAELIGTDPARVAVEVTNTGAHASREVVQVYFVPAEAGEPVRLVGWSGVRVEPGQRARVEVACDERMWRRWSVDRHAWDRLGGGGQLLIARGLGDIRARIEVAER